MNRLALTLFFVPAAALLSGCAGFGSMERTAAPVAVTAAPSQCTAPGPDGRRSAVRLPGQSREAACHAEAWCVAAADPSTRDLMYAQTFRMCMAGTAAAAQGGPAAGMPAAPVVAPSARPAPGVPPRPDRQ